MTHSVKSVRHPVDLAGVFTAKEYSYMAFYSGPLNIGDGMAINVRAFLPRL